MVDWEPVYIQNSTCRNHLLGLMFCYSLVWKLIINAQGEGRGRETSILSTYRQYTTYTLSPLLTLLSGTLPPVLKPEFPVGCLITAPEPMWERMEGGGREGREKEVMTTTQNFSTLWLAPLLPWAGNSKKLACFFSFSCGLCISSSALPVYLFIWTRKSRILYPAAS